MKKSAFAALAIVAVAGCGGSGHNFTPSNYGGLIAFYAGGYLATMEQDGNNQQSLGTIYFVASMSQNRKVVTSSVGSNQNIVCMNADGSHKRTLTQHASADFRPAISPDGSKVAFISERDGNREIYIMDIDGGNETRLTNDPAEDYFPAFSADGTKIIFTSKRDGNEEIYIMDADGGNQTRITNNPATDSTPAFSPDGTQILFCTDRDGNYEIYKADANGANQTRITNTPDNEVHASWNIAGTHIFYYDEVAIRRIDPDGTGRTDIYTGGVKTCTWVY